MRGRHLFTTLALIVGVVALSPACSSGGSPTAATTATLADFGGHYTGTYRITKCTSDGAFTGFCDSSDFTSEQSLPIDVTFTQSGSSVSGPATLGSAVGRFQGTVSGSTLTGTATFDDVTQQGVTLTTSISNWSTTITGNAQSGTFNLVLRVGSISGAGTLTASINRLTR